MFNRIQIKQDSSTGSPVFDIAALIDSMLYYREVIIIASHLEMNLLIDEFGEDNLLELLKTGRLTLKLNCQHFGVRYYPETSDVVSVGNYSLNYHNAEDLLLYNRRRRIDDINACELFVKKFSPYVSLYEFPLTINDLYYKDFEDVGFMSQIAKDYLSIYYPEYHQANEIQLVLDTVSNLSGFYRIKTNIDVEQLNRIHAKRGVSYPFMFSNLLFAVGNTNMDVYSTSDFGSELDPDPRFGYAFNTRIDSCIDRAKRSNDQLSSFQSASCLRRSRKRIDPNDDVRSAHMPAHSGSGIPDARKCPYRSLHSAQKHGKVARFGATFLFLAMIAQCFGDENTRSFVRCS